VEGIDGKVRMGERPRKPVTTPETRAPRVTVRVTMDKHVRAMVVHRPTGHKIHGWVITLGSGGMFVETQEPFQPDEFVIVDALARSGDRALHLRAEGWVVYTLRGGMGIQFGELEPEMADRVAAVMDHYRDPESPPDPAWPAATRLSLENL
jgi:hypothetical protein